MPSLEIRIENIVREYFNPNTWRPSRGHRI